ncbi:MAG: hypothetical protein KF779_03100 [Hyphomonadaceae bacterium]|nr:hypothetical protein [Hyphomonadaceae bacterium]
MKSRAALAALLLSPLLMAQTAPPATITDNGAPVFEAQAVEFSADPQQATGTAVLLSQQANVIGVVRVDAPVAGSIAVGNASIALQLTPGTELFPVVLQQHREARLFCTVAVDITPLTPLRPPLVSRACLADTNGDRVFDYLGYMQVGVTPTRSVTGAWETPPVPRVSGGTVILATAPIRSPAPFTPLQQHSIAPVTIEVTARIVGDTVAVDLRSREGDASAPINDQRVTTVAANMPRTITLSGAQIELQSLSAGTLTYRVVSALATGQPIAITNTRR